MASGQFLGSVSIFSLLNSQLGGRALMSSLPSGISWKVRLWCYNKANILEPPSARIFVPSVALGFTIWILLIRMPLFGVIFSFSVKNLIFMSLVVFSFLNKAGTVINVVFPEGYLQVSVRFRYILLSFVDWILCFTEIVEPFYFLLRVSMLPIKPQI